VVFNFLSLGGMGFWFSWRVYWCCLDGGFCMSVVLRLVCMGKKFVGYKFGLYWMFMLYGFVGFLWCCSFCFCIFEWI